MHNHWMGEVCLRWKNFKNKLTKKYIRGAKRDKDPCQDYDYISPEDWREFVASRQNPEFLEKSQANRERQAKNKYLHCMSRGGYKKLERKLMEEELQRMKEAAQSDLSTVIQAPEHPPRHKKWIAARKKGDKYVNEDVAEVALKIDVLEQQSSQDSFTPGTRMDILSMAIGKPNYLEAVRGEPRGVSVAKYLGRRSSCSHDDDNPSPQLVAKIRASLVDEVMTQLRGEMRVMIQEKVNTQHTNQESLAFPSSKESFHVLDVPIGEPSHHSPNVLIGELSHTPQGGQICTLYLDDPHQRIVANGLVYPEQTTHHNMQIPQDQRRVILKSVREGEKKTAIPIDEEEVPTLGTATTSFILWPHHLIPMGTTPPMHEQATGNFLYLAQLRELYPDIVSIGLQMPPSIVGADKTYSINVDKKDLTEFTHMDCLDIQWLQLAIFVCHDICKKGGRLGSYGFLCPGSTASARNILAKRAIYVGLIMGDLQSSCYLTPIHESGHWTLCIVCPAKNACYWFDSVGGRPIEDIKNMFADLLEHESRVDRSGFIRSAINNQGTPSADTTLSVGCNLSFPPDVLLAFKTFLVLRIRTHRITSIRFETCWLDIFLNTYS